MRKVIEENQINYRDLFELDDEYIYFNSAGTSPVPKVAKTAAIECYNFKSYTSHRDAELFLWLERIRSLAGKLINAESSEIALTGNTSLGLNMAAQGIELDADDSVLVHRSEFPANMAPWLHLNKKGVDVRIIESDGFPTLEDYEKRVDGTTRVIAVSFVRFFDGFKIDLPRMGEFCRERGIILVVDGIQGIGIVPLDVKEMGIDILSCGGAKWLCSPCGTGFLYVSKKMQEKLKSPFAGWLSWLPEKKFDNCILKLPEEPNDMTRFEIGTIPYPSFAAFEKTLELFLDIGVENIYAHVKALLDFLIEFISKRDDYKMSSSLHDNHRSGFISIKSMKDNYRLMDRLVEEKIVVSLREGGIRVAPHLYNTMDEMQRFCEVLADF